MITRSISYKPTIEVFNELHELATNIQFGRAMDEIMDTYNLGPCEQHLLTAVYYAMYPEKFEALLNIAHAPLY